MQEVSIIVTIDKTENFSYIKNILLKISCFCVTIKENKDKY